MSPENLPRWLYFTIDVVAGIIWFATAFAFLLVLFTILQP